MDISVVITSYNHGEFLGEAIESALSQSMSPYEVVIVDDASTDASLDVIHYYSKHVKVIRNSHNLGGAKTASIGVASTSGNYVAMLNSDDKWGIEKLKNQSLFMTANDLDCSFTTAVIIDEMSNPMSPYPRQYDSFQRVLPKNGSFLSHFLNHGNFLCHSSMVANRELFSRTGGYDTRLRQLPDFAKWIEFAKIGKLGILPQSLTCYRHLGIRNASSSDSKDVSLLTEIEYLHIIKSFFNDMTDSQIVNAFIHMSLGKKNITRLETIVKILLSIPEPPLRELGRSAALAYILDNWESSPDSELLKEVLKAT